jgi:type IV secretory pathway VirB10-like protein
MLRRSGLLALLLLVTAGLAAPSLAQTESPAAMPAAAKPAAPKPPAKPAVKRAAKPAAAPAAAVPAVPLTPEEASRQAYKAQLSETLARLQATVRKQQGDLATEQGRLKDLYSEMMEAVSKSEGDSASAGGASASAGGPGGPNAKKELSPAVKASVSYEAQTYKVQVARQALLSSEKEALRLQGFLARVSQ